MRYQFIAVLGIALIGAFGMSRLADLVTNQDPTESEIQELRDRIQQLENMVLDAVSPFTDSRFVVNERILAKRGLDILGVASQETRGRGINFFIPAASPEYGMVVYRFASGEPFMTIGTRDPGDSSTHNKISMGNAQQNFTVDGTEVLRNTTTEVIVYGILNLGAGLSEKTIASGAITITKSFHLVDTQNNDATDDLDTVNGGSAGDILILKADNTARTVVVKDGTGNLDLAGDFSLDGIDDTIMLVNTGTNWKEISRSNNSA